MDSAWAMCLSEVVYIDLKTGILYRKRREKIGLYTDRESIGNNTKKDLFSKRFRRISCQSGFYNRCDWADDLPISE